jgi:hypothetical protein
VCQQDVEIWPYIYDYYCPFPNAFWDGYQFAFGQGYAVDDVAAHEFTHALIDHASQLYYAYQAGAINESLADIFGELFDQSYVMSGGAEFSSALWLIGEDLPVHPHPEINRRELRDMANPGRLGQPSQYFGANYYQGADDNGGVHQNSGVGNKLAHLIAVGGSGYPGIGVAKSRQLWYRVAHLLPSASDFPTLGRVVQQACVELVGHHGFTADNCFNTIWSARIATNLNQGESFHGCGGGSTPDPAVLSEDFEDGGQAWTLTGGWYHLPSPEVPVSYAASGKHSLYGYVPGGAPTGYATFNGTVAIPNNTTYGGPFLSYQLLAPGLPPGYATTGPMWQYDDVSDGAGWQNLAQAWTVEGGDRSREQTAGITTLAGKTVQLRVELPPGAPTDFVIDDVAISGCTYTYYSRPTNISSVWSGTNATVTWKYSGMPLQHTELTYDPPIPGAPASLPGPGVNQSDLTQTLNLTGLDPSVVYRVTISIIDDQNHQPALPVTYELRSQPTELCLTSPPLPFSLPVLSSDRRPEDGCGSAGPVPRKVDR